MGQLPEDSKERKGIPIVEGCLDYFAAALCEIAKLSLAGNEKHNPGQPLHWSREKSSDHASCIVRHLLDRGSVDPDDGILHSVKLAWRALALAQLELEAAGAPVSRGSRLAANRSATDSGVGGGHEARTTEPENLLCPHGLPNHGIVVCPNCRNAAKKCRHGFDIAGCPG